MLVKSPTIFRKMFPELIWDVKTNKKEIYITFDDGPHPGITPWVLEILNKYNAKATFFCVGDNVRKYPDTYKLILDKGHGVGNHSYNHLNGWRTNNSDYVRNIEKAGQLIDSSLFRPPYGRITPSQIKQLKKNYSVVMWSVLTYDFDNNISKDKCFKNSIIATKSGSIVVFHDSLKSETNLRYALPLFLQHAADKGFIFSLL